MNKAETQHNWSEFIGLFSRQYRSRPTRLGIFEGRPEAMTDYWLEDGLSLGGITVDLRGKDAPIIQIMLGGSGENFDTPHLTHTIANAASVKIFLSANGESEGLDIEDAHGRTTVLRFEN